MEFPSPENPQQAPVWENYVIAQAAQASLRLIPTDVHALGVELDGPRVVLVAQAAARTPDAGEGLTDITDELELLLGPDVDVSHRFDIRAKPLLHPADGVCWFFAARG